MDNQSFNLPSCKLSVVFDNTLSPEEIGDGFVPANVISSVLDFIESYFLGSEIKILRESVIDVFGSDFWDVISDEVMIKCRQKGNWKITSAKTGSIIITGLVTTIATWLLLNTLGESFKDAWKDSQTHHNFKNILTKKLDSFFKKTALKNARGLYDEENILLESLSKHVFNETRTLIKAKIIHDTNRDTITITTSTIRTSNPSLSKHAKEKMAKMLDIDLSPRTPKIKQKKTAANRKNKSQKPTKNQPKN
jgi:hypothetical protein